MFVQAIDIAGDVQTDSALGRFDREIKEMVLGQRRPGNVTGTMTLAGLRSLSMRSSPGSTREADPRWTSFGDVWPPTAFPTSAKTCSVTSWRGVAFVAAPNTRSRW